MDQEILAVKQRFGIVGNSSLLNHAISVAMKVAATDMSVLITGESGSGKESFSKIIHSLSPAKHGQFIAINCGAIPEGTIDSELFGHEKGAFTGAVEARKGYFEVTDSGTIFLDEIGEMPLSTQARLLRVLENGEFIRVGSSQVRKTQVRIVAATNVNLIKAVEKKKFREDLYYRLSTVPIYVPPLRERGNDISLLFRKFASDFSEKYRTPPIELSEEAEHVLINYRFPGNIRQLKNIVEQISVLELEKQIDRETLERYLPKNHQGLPELAGGRSASQNTEERSGSNHQSDFTERDILYKVLFDMRKDVTELKKLVLNILRRESYGRDVLNDHEELFNNLDHESANEPKSEVEKQTFLLTEGERRAEESNKNIFDIQNIEDASIDVEESLSIEDKEKELIIKALEKNNNKRKDAARDLGISERTLYRKLKQYEIDK
ncbi:MAG: sigma-54 dependent transcriptional regulator [Cyclobacteriaceae bacterium]|nr:sigma-54-dependent Fis family transcriptional regulator [Cyclobacteriaceae bacterium]MCH8516108.1 sigma-54 dependent transcriptional regulator [Cyclobacteriaceae bacterium]